MKYVHKLWNMCLLPPYKQMQLAFILHWASLYNSIRFWGCRKLSSHGSTTSPLLSSSALVGASGTMLSDESISSSEIDSSGTTSNRSSGTGQYSMPSSPIRTSLSSSSIQAFPLTWPSFGITGRDTTWLRTCIQVDTLKLVPLMQRDLHTRRKKSTKVDTCHSIREDYACTVCHLYTVPSAFNTCISLRAPFALMYFTVWQCNQQSCIHSWPSKRLMSV